MKLSLELDAMQYSSLVLHWRDNIKKKNKKHAALFTSAFEGIMSKLPMVLPWAHRHKKAHIIKAHFASNNFAFYTLIEQTNVILEAWNCCSW